MHSATLYRDKALMKHSLKQQGIKTPEFKKIFYATDLINFIEKVGYDVIVKPNLGAGSANTIIIKDEAQLDSLLIHGLVDSSYGTPDLIAESFIKGKMYHVDGLILNKKLIINQPFAYFNSCIEFQKGTHVGSYMLDDANLMTTRLRDLNAQVLSILPSPNNFAFHVEYFHDDNDQLIFCEVASRPGGGVVKDSIYTRYGVNIVTEWIKSEIDVNYQLSIQFEYSDSLTGFLLIPPASGILKYVPQEIPFDWVKQYRITASINSEYKGNARISGEIVSILVASKCESELQERINTVSMWINENLVWA